MIFSPIPAQALDEVLETDYRREEIVSEDDESSEAGSSVNFSGSSSFDSEQNIDGFLGKYDRGFSGKDESYDGTRSEDYHKPGALPF